MSEQHPFITEYTFARDDSKPGRILHTVHVGDAYVSRLVIAPGVITGNYYHKRTQVLFFVEKGDIFAALEHVESGERKEIHLRPGKHAIHVPTHVSFATKNVSDEEAVLFYFSNHPLRLTQDRFEYEVLGPYDTDRKGEKEVRPSMIQVYDFQEDLRKPGRELHAVKVGDVYITRAILPPGQVRTNFYYKRTNLMLFVEAGEIQIKFIQIQTGEVKEIVYRPGSGIVHIPPYIALACRNIGSLNGVIVLFSDGHIRSEDNYHYPVYEE